MDQFVTCELCGKELSVEKNPTYVLCKHLASTHPESDISHFVCNMEEGKKRRNSKNCSVAKISVRDLEKDCGCSLTKIHIQSLEDIAVESITFFSDKTNPAIQKRNEQFVYTTALPGNEYRVCDCNNSSASSRKSTKGKSKAKKKAQKLNKKLYAFQTGIKKLHKTTVECWQPGTAEIFCPYCEKSGKPFIRKQKNKVAYTSIGSLCLLAFWPLCFMPITSGSSSINVYCKHCGYLCGIYDRKDGKLIYTKDDGKTATVDIPDFC